MILHSMSSITAEPLFGKMSNNSLPEQSERAERTTREKATTIIVNALFVISVGLIVIASFSIVLWTLVAFAQNNNSGGPDCLSREEGNGFSGNPDFYGFGIRLGVYFQWWASLIANFFQLEDRGAMFAGYLVFSTALIVAVLMLTFQHACTFTAEIIVILFIHWGGFIGLLYSTDIVLASSPNDSVSRFGVGKSYALYAPLWIGTAFSTWFWLRLATVGEADFEPTPGGTFYFVFSRVSTNTKAASRFIVFLCFFIGWAMVSYSLGFTAGFVWASVRGFYRVLSHDDEESRIETRSTDSSEDEDEALFLKRYVFPSGPRHMTDTIVTKRTFGVLSVLILVYSTIAVELTLVWNSVSGVYTVSSTGQVIPLIAGLGLFINAIWKLEPWDRFVSQPHEHSYWPWANEEFS